MEEQLAKNELPIETQQLLSEIVPLIEDYFYGKVSLDGQRIVYEMPNGQTFFITAKSV